LDRFRLVKLSFAVAEDVGEVCCIDEGMSFRALVVVVEPELSTLAVNADLFYIEIRQMEMAVGRVVRIQYLHQTLQRRDGQLAKLGAKANLQPVFDLPHGARQDPHSYKPYLLDPMKNVPAAFARQQWKRHSGQAPSQRFCADHEI
jgi:hypothetical protein